MSKYTKHSLSLMEGYESNYKKNDIIQKLGDIEHQSESISEDICAEVCRHFGKTEDPEEMDILCAACPLTRLMELIG